MRAKRHEATVAVDDETVKLVLCPQISPNKLNAYAATVNEHHIVYGATTSNSNAYAHEAVTVLGVGRPDPIVDAPGHDTKLIQ